EPTTRMRGDSEFTFKHVLIRDVAYGTLPRADRRSRHTAVARYIEGVAGEQFRDIAWLLAHHWREAGEPEDAVESLPIAAGAARCEGAARTSLWPAQPGPCHARRSRGPRSGQGERRPRAADLDPRDAPGRAGGAQRDARPHVLLDGEVRRGRRAGASRPRHR